MIVLVLKMKTLDSGFVFSSSVGCRQNILCCWIAANRIMIHFWLGLKNLDFALQNHESNAIRQFSWWWNVLGFLCLLFWFLVPMAWCSMVGNPHDSTWFFHWAGMKCHEQIFWLIFSGWPHFGKLRHNKCISKSLLWRNHRWKITHCLLLSRPFPYASNKKQFLSWFKDFEPGWFGLLCCILKNRKCFLFVAKWQRIGFFSSLFFGEIILICWAWLNCQTLPIIVKEHFKPLPCLWRRWNDVRPFAIAVVCSVVRMLRILRWGQGVEVRFLLFLKAVTLLSSFLPDTTLAPISPPFEPVSIVVAVGSLDWVCWQRNKLNANWLLEWGRLPLSMGITLDNSWFLAKNVNVCVCVCVCCEVQI